MLLKSLVFTFKINRYISKRIFQQMKNAKCIHIRCQKMRFRSKPCIILFYVKKNKIKKNTTGIN